MNTILHRNIDLVQIKLKAGVERYYFPQNVDWANKVIDRIAICLPNNQNNIDPMDGVGSVADFVAKPEFYLYMSDANEKEIFHEVFSDNFVNRNNYIIDIHKKLNLSLCYMNFTQAPAADQTLLMYVFYGDREVTEFEYPVNSITVDFEMQPNEELTFQELINQYVHALPAKIKGIVAWNPEANPTYLTMRDHQLTYVIRDLHTEMLRPDMYQAGTSATDTQVHPMWFDDIDIDFDYSRVRNAVAATIHPKLTFYF